MGRHRAPLTRGDLLARYATATGLSFDEAHNIHGDTEVEDLRATVESLEAYTPDPVFPRRRSFARSLPTTSVQGYTR